MSFFQVSRNFINLFLRFCDTRRKGGGNQGGLKCWEGWGGMWELPPPPPPSCGWFMTVCRLSHRIWSTLCTENRIYEFPEKELRSLSSNSYIHVSVCDLYIPRIGPHIWLQQNRQTDSGNIKIAHRYLSKGIGRQNIIILFGNNKASQFNFCEYINGN